MPPHEDGFELIELNKRAREFLLLDVYERLGFVAMGEPMLSTKFQGKFKILMIRDAAPIS